MKKIIITCPQCRTISPFTQWRKQTIVVCPYCNYELPYDLKIRLLGLGAMASILNQLDLRSHRNIEEQYSRDCTGDCNHCRPSFRCERS